MCNHYIVRNKYISKCIRNARCFAKVIYDSLLQNTKILHTNIKNGPIKWRYLQCVPYSWNINKHDSSLCDQVTFSRLLHSFLGNKPFHHHSGTSDWRGRVHPNPAKTGFSFVHSTQQGLVNFLRKNKITFEIKTQSTFTLKSFQ